MFQHFQYYLLIFDSNIKYFIPQIGNKGLSEK